MWSRDGKMRAIIRSMDINIIMSQHQAQVSRWYVYVKKRGCLFYSCLYLKKIKKVENHWLRPYATENGFIAVVYSYFGTDTH